MSKAHKNMRGEWSAQTDVKLEGAYILRVSTFKGSSGYLTTTATRMVDQGDGGVSFIMFRDFNITVIRDKVRVTERAINAQHNTAMAEIEAIKEACAAHYAKES